MRRNLLALMAAGTLVLAACGGSDPAASAGAALLVSIDGDTQVATVATPLARPLTVRLVDAAGNAVAGQTVRFEVVSGGGSLFVGVSTTDGAGLARDRWTLGRTTRQEQRVEARALDANGAPLTVTFAASALAGPAVSLVPFAFPQSGVQAQRLPEPVQVRVEDGYGNPVVGTAVSFTADSGGSAAPAVVVSDAAGVASSHWTLGVPVGPQSLTVGTSGVQPATVTAQALRASPSEATRLAVVEGDGQTVVQHRHPPTRLVAWVTDALGNGVPGIAVTFAPPPGGPAFTPQTIVTSDVATDGGGFARFDGWFHVAGAQTVMATAGTLPSATFTLQVNPSTHRFDGRYGCSFGVEGAPLDIVDGVPVPLDPANGRGIFASFDEATGAVAGYNRVGLDLFYYFSATLSVDANEVAGGSGPWEYRRNGVPVDSGTMTCGRI